MGSSTRKTGSYKQKTSMLAFGHIALPIAAVVAVCLLFVGVKLFFLSPSEDEIMEFEPGNVAAPQDVNDAKTKDTVKTDPAAQQTAVVQQKNDPAPAKSGQNSAPSNGSSQPAQLAGPIGSSQTTSAPKPATPQKPTTSTAQPAKPKPATPTPQKTTTTTTPPAQSGGFSVQIGAFTRIEGAEEVVKSARSMGYSPRISSVESSGRTYHRVRINAGTSRADADKLAAELEKRGFPVAVVAN